MLAWLYYHRHHMHQSMWITRVPPPPAGRPSGFWHLNNSSVKVPRIICTYCTRILSISYPRKWESLYFKCQNCPWVWIPSSQPHGWDVRIPWVAKNGSQWWFTLTGALNNQKENTIWIFIKSFQVHFVLGLCMPCPNKVLSLSK